MKEKRSKVLLDHIKRIKKVLEKNKSRQNT